MAKEIFNIPPEHQDHAVDDHIPSDYEGDIDAELSAIDLDHLDDKEKIKHYLDIYAKKVLPRILHDQFPDEWDDVKLLLHSEEGVKAIVTILLAQPGIVGVMSDKNQRSQAAFMRRDAARSIRDMAKVFKEPSTANSLKRASDFMIADGGKELLDAIETRAKEYGHPLVEEVIGPDSTPEALEARKAQEEKEETVRSEVNSLLIQLEAALQSGNGDRASIIERRIMDRADPKNGVYDKELKEYLEDDILEMKQRASDADKKAESQAKKDKADILESKVRALLDEYKQSVKDGKTFVGETKKAAIEKHLQNSDLKEFGNYDDFVDEINTELSKISQSAEVAKATEGKIQTGRLAKPIESIDSLDPATRVNVEHAVSQLEEIRLFGDPYGLLAAIQKYLKEDIVSYVRINGNTEWAEALSVELEKHTDIELLTGRYAEDQTAKMWMKVRPELGIGFTDQQIALENATSKIILQFREDIRKVHSLGGPPAPQIIGEKRELAQNNFEYLVKSCRRQGVLPDDIETLQRFFDTNINADFEQTKPEPLIDREMPGSTKDNSTKAYFAMWVKRFGKISEGDRDRIFASPPFVAETYDSNAMMHFMRANFGSRYRNVDTLDLHLSDTSGNIGKRERTEAEKMHILQSGIDLYRDNQQRLTRGESPINGREIDPAQVHHLNELNSAARYLATMQAEIMFYHEGHRGRDRLVRERDMARARYHVLMDIMAAQISAEYAGPPEDEREHMINFLRQTQLEEDLKLQNTFDETAGILNEVFTPSSETSQTYKAWENLNEGTQSALKVGGFVATVSLSLAIAPPLGVIGGGGYVAGHVVRAAYNKISEFASGGEIKRRDRHDANKARLRQEYRVAQDDADWQHHIHGVAEYFIAANELEERYTRRRDLGRIAVWPRIRSNARLRSGVNVMEFSETIGISQQVTQAAHRIRQFQNSVGVTPPPGSTANHFYLSEAQSLRAVTCLSRAEIATLNSINTVAELNSNTVMSNRLLGLINNWRGYNSQHGAFVNKKVLKR